MKKTLLVLSILLSNAYAAGGGGHLTDLVIPALNFVVFAGIIFLAIKGPMKKMFSENAVKVKELYTYAEGKDKEAQIKLDMYEKKMNSLQSEIQKINEDIQKDEIVFKENVAKETAAQLEKMQKDSILKLESEKNSLLKNLNEALVNEVIAKAKNKISENKDYKEKATKKLVAEL